MRRIRPLGGLAMGSVARRMGDARPGAADAPAAPPRAAGVDIATALRGVMDQLAEGLSTFTTLAGPEAGSGSGAHSAGGGRLVFGYSIRMGEAGVSAEPFGNVAHQHHNRPAQPGAATRQPIVDIFEEVDGYLVVAELPGVQLQEITCTVLDTILHIRTAGPRPYAKEVVLPGPANPESLSVSCQHGILEVRLSHAGQAA